MRWGSNSAADFTIIKNPQHGLNSSSSVLSRSAPAQPRDQHASLDFSIEGSARGWGQQLTWMDAKVYGAVISPRSGKPVEMNVLRFCAQTRSVAAR